MTETTKEYIDRYRRIYDGINSVNSKCLDKRVVFTTPGFKHLVYKGGRRRPNKVIKSRLKLISLAVPVLKNSSEVIETRIRKENHYGQRLEIKYEAVEAVVSKSQIRVRVVVRTIGKKGTPHFFSIMKY